MAPDFNLITANAAPKANMDSMPDEILMKIVEHAVFKPSTGPVRFIMRPVGETDFFAPSAGIAPFAPITAGRPPHLNPNPARFGGSVSHPIRQMDPIKLSAASKLITVSQRFHNAVLEVANRDLRRLMRDPVFSDNFVYDYDKSNLACAAVQKDWKETYYYALEHFIEHAQTLQNVRVQGNATLAFDSLATLVTKSLTDLYDAIDLLHELHGVKEENIFLHKCSDRRDDYFDDIHDQMNNLRAEQTALLDAYHKIESRNLDLNRKNIKLALEAHDCEKKEVKAKKEALDLMKEKHELQKKVEHLTTLAGQTHSSSYGSECAHEQDESAGTGEEVREYRFPPH